MNYLSIDYLIVGAFLLITLLVGLWAGRGIKDIREYAIANKQIGTGVLTMTILATYITGSKGIGYVGHVFDNGIIPILPVLFCGVICCFLFIIKFIAPRIHHFSGCLTAAELMGKFYGYHARLAIAILGIFYAITLVIRQISWLSAIGELLSIPPNLAIVFIGLFLISYAAQGGMKAVTTTDVMQFIAIVVMVPLVAYVVLYRVGGIRASLNALPSGALDITHHPNFRGYLSHSVWNLFPAFPLSFPFIQRMLMAKDKQQLVNSYYVVMTCLVIVFLLFTLIGLGAIAMRTGGDVNVPAKGSKIFFYVVKNYFSTSGQGLIAVGMIAGVMSTADSFLHAAGLMLAHDVVQPFCAKKKLEINELTWARVGTCFTGILALWGAYNYQVLPHIKYAGVSLNETLNVITRPVALLFTIPLIAGIMGLKTDARSFFISCIATITVFITSQFCLDPSLVIPCCIVTNALSFFGAHYFHNQGFAVVKRVATQQEAHVWRPSWQGSSKRLNSLLPTPQKLLHYSQDKLAKYGANSTLFALFMAFNYMAPFFMHSYASPAAYSCLLVIRGMGALLCVGLLLKEVWPARLVPYFASYYHFSLLYCLPFVTTFLFFLEGSSIHWLINVCLSIMLLIVLADWLTFILLSLLGVLLAIVTYKVCFGSIVTPDNDTLYTLVYTCLFSTLIGLLFARRKQQSFDNLDLRNKRLVTSHEETTHELLISSKDIARFTKAFRESGAPGLTQLATLSKKIVATTKELNLPPELTQDITQLHEKLTPIALQLDKLDHRAIGYLRLETDTITIDTFLQAVQEKLHAKGLDKGIRWKKVTQHKAVQCDVAKIETLLVNSISFIRAVGGEERPVLLALEDTQLGYRLNSVTPDYTKQVAALRITITTESMLPTLEEHYLAQMNEDTYSMPETPTALPLVANERIVKAHYGYNSTVVNDSKFTQLYVIPVKLREVRPKDMDLPAMELGAELTRADDTYPGAQEQEATFLQAVQEHTQADLELVRKAIELIKQYHGPVCRNSGEPFYLHPLAVAHIVLDYNQDEATVLGALLHDTVEDTSLTIDQVEIRFNKEVRNIVDGVTHLDSYKGTFYKVKLSSHENIRMLLEVVDKRALYVKIADRTHNMRTIQYKPYKSQRRTAEETLLFFVPLAEKLELYKAAQELKERSFEVLTKNSNER